MYCVICNNSWSAYVIISSVCAVNHVSVLSSKKYTVSKAQRFIIESVCMWLFLKTHKLNAVKRQKWCRFRCFLVTGEHKTWLARTNQDNRSICCFCATLRLINASYFIEINIHNHIKIIIFSFNFNCVTLLLSANTLDIPHRGTYTYWQMH